MENTDKEVLDYETNPEMKEAMEETQKNLAKTSEIKEEVESEPQPKEEVKPTPAVKQEETPEPKIETPKFNTVPLAKYVNTEKELKALKAELKQIKEQSQEAETPAEKKEVSDSLKAFAEKNGMDIETLQDLKGVILHDVNPQLAELSELKKQREQQEQEDNINQYLAGEFEKILPDIKKEHGELTEVQKEVFRKQLINKAKERGVMDLDLIYHGVEEFRPQKDIITAERDNSKVKSKVKIVDKNNPTMDDINEMTDDERIDYLMKNSETGY